MVHESRRTETRAKVALPSLATEAQVSGSGPGPGQAPSQVGICMQPGPVTVHRQSQIKTRGFQQLNV